MERLFQMLRDSIKEEIRMYLLINRKYHFSVHFLLMILMNFAAIGQEKASNIDFRGYVKNMSTFVEVGDSLWYENLTHNRLNFEWFPNDNFTVYVQVRNRFIAGDFVKYSPGYAEGIDDNNDYFDFSHNLIDEENYLLNVALDRFYFEWIKGNWEVSVGRQRVNWGINLAWNPNDIFNAYNFFDFDYEERRGSDAMRIIYYTDVASSWELSGTLARNIDDWVGGGKRTVNKWGYDIQSVGGIANGDFMLGTGWAGNIGLAGFKGEITALFPIIDTKFNTNYDHMVIASSSIDYSFANSLYLNGSFLYNSQKALRPSLGGFTQAATSDFTMRNLSNYKWSAFVQSAYQFTPLIYGSISVMGFPGTEALFINPAVSMSLTQNLDLGVFGQLFFDEDFQGNWTSNTTAGFVRLKWSF